MIVMAFQYHCYTYSDIETSNETLHKFAQHTVGQIWQQTHCMFWMCRLAITVFIVLAKLTCANVQGKVKCLRFCRQQPSVNMLSTRKFNVHSYGLIPVHACQCVQSHAHPAPISACSWNLLAQQRGTMLIVPSYHFKQQWTQLLNNYW